jgi:hypothetical protein
MSAVVTAIVLATVASTATAIYEGDKSATAQKKAAAHAEDLQRQAAAQLQASQDAASTQAKNALASRQRAAIQSQDVYTNPLGVGGQAAVNRKTLLGQ